jgi:hypothetical protein
MPRGSRSQPTVPPVPGEVQSQEVFQVYVTGALHALGGAVDALLEGQDLAPEKIEEAIRKHAGGCFARAVVWKAGIAILVSAIVAAAVGYGIARAFGG